MTAAAGERTLYERVGGQDFFDRVVDYFYDAVERDLILLPLYPEGAATSGARRRLALFLAQYWGGPTTYSEERGHPRLRMRHGPYVIGELERDRWLRHMTAAIETAVADFAGAGVADLADAGTADEVCRVFTDYVVTAADHLRNS